MTSTTITKDGRAPRGPVGPRKGLIEPGVIDIIPEGKGSILSAVQVFIQVVNGKLQLRKDFADPDHPCWTVHGTMAENQQRIDRYNNGERFFDLPENL